MPAAPDNIPDNIEFAAQELLEAPAGQRQAILQGIAKALTRLQGNPGMGIREVVGGAAPSPRRSCPAYGRI
jgi:hypothetical protein